MGASRGGLHTQGTPAWRAGRTAEPLTLLRVRSPTLAPGRAARRRPARTRERETLRSKAGKGSRMRGSELRARQDGEGEVEFPRGNLTR